MKKISLFIFAVLLLFSCQQEKKDVKTIAKEYAVAKKQILSTKYNTHNVSILDSYVLVKNIYIKDRPLFSLYANDKGDFTHLLDFGKDGNGPNEFESGVYYTRQFVIENNQVKFWVYEKNRKRYSQINLTKSIEEKKTVIDNVVKIRSGIKFADLFYVNDKVVGNVSNLSKSQKQLLFYNFKKDTIIKSVDFNFTVENPNKKDAHFTLGEFNGIYLNSLRYQAKQGKLVSAMLSLKELNVFNINGALVASLNKEPLRIKKVDEFLKEEKIYFADMQLTDNFIYTLYSGETETNYYEKASPVTIKIYDWNCNLKATIPLKESINFISVDEKNKFLVGVSITQEKVMQYDLSEFLKKNN